MNMSRYRYRPVTVPLPSRYHRVTVPLPLPRYRDSPSATVTDRYGPFTTVTERYQPLPNLTVTCVTSVTLIFLLNFKYLFKTHYITIGNA